MKKVYSRIRHLADTRVIWGDQWPVTSSHPRVRIAAAIPPILEHDWIWSWLEYRALHTLIKKET